MSARTHRSAFTLVELLVVLAIIAILTATAIPAMRQLGIIGRNAVDMSSRELLTMLKAARIYAGTHNVDTAVVYAINELPDIDTPDATDAVEFMDAVGILRRVRDAELPYFDAGIDQHVDELVQSRQVDAGDAPALRLDLKAHLRSSETGDMNAFTPIRGGVAILEPLMDGAVIATYSGTFPPNPPVVVQAVEAWAEGRAGMCAVHIVDENGARIEPRKPTLAYAPPSATQGNCYPAHVFKPSGVLQTPGTEVSRFLVSVIPSPDSAQDERFYLDPATNTQRPVPPAQVQIYSATGRIESTS